MNIYIDGFISIHLPSEFNNTFCHILSVSFINNLSLIGFLSFYYETGTHTKTGSGNAEIVNSTKSPFLIISD